MKKSTSLCRMFMRTVATWGFLWLPLSFYAQSGSIGGKLTDDKSGEPLVNAYVIVPGTPYLAQADSTGQYELKNIAAGKYDLVFFVNAYKPDTLRSVDVMAGRPTLVDRKLSSNAKTLGEVDVVFLKPTDTDLELIRQIRDNSRVASGISAEQISKGQDRDAADAVRRIPGVTLNDDRFIVVRGLNERYNAVWLNNINAPSAEADKKSFSFDVIPSTLIDQVIVYKTPAADLPGDFAGGMTKIFTKTAPLGHSFVFDYNAFYRPGSTGQELQLTEGSKTDYLGYDNGFRKVPAGVPDNKYEQSSSYITRQFKNTWVTHDQKAAPDNRFSFCYSLGFKVKRVQVGSVTAFNYANQSTLYNIHRTEYESDKATAVPDKPTVDYNDAQSTSSVRLGAIQNFMVVLNAGNKIEFKNLFSQSGRDQTTLRTGTDGGANVRYYAFGYQSRTLFSSQLEYSHTGKSNINGYNCTIGYSVNNRNDPDLRRITYQYPPDTMFRSNIPPGSGQLDVTDGATRYYSKLNEKVYSFNQSYRHNFAIGTYHFNVNAGSYIEYKSRVFTSRLFGYTLPVSALRRQFSALNVNEIFSDKYVDVIDTMYGQHRQAGFRIYDGTSPSDSYNGQNLLIAPYASVELPLAKKLKLLAGVRMEDNTQSLQTLVGVDSILLKTHTRYYLPSFNLRYDLGKKSLLRLVYGETLNRPEFREAAPFLYYDFELMALSHGSLFPSVDHPGGVQLKTATIQNFDLRYELYPGAGEMINAGVFYKKFTNPIEQIAEAHEHRTGVSRETSFRNSDAAYCLGLEVELRKNLGAFDNMLGTKVFRRFSFISNLSLIKSRVTNAGDSLSKPRALQGQAPYLVNAGLYYGNKLNPRALQVSIVYNIIGPRIFLVGGTDGPHTQSGPSIGEMPRHSLDLTVRKNITKQVSVNLGVQNLLNQSVLFVEDSNQDGKFSTRSGDKALISYKKGSYFTFGIKIQL